MGRKGTDVVHIGRRSWWSGKVRTLCGLVYLPGNEQEQGWFTRITCPACKAAEKRGVRL
ncbi:hypothetical protein [Prauserella sp. PE36]|uniref:hypothetical protein n=1 Tax=Prauserella sp. PE36 TaxID=1504709 RepID=UPI0018F3E8FD|nr:hypothetical protein [Prauserella sp. PE36]